MRATFSTLLTVFIFLSVWATSTRSESFDLLEAREWVDELTARDVYDYYKDLERREVLSELSTRELIEELEDRLYLPETAIYSRAGARNRNPPPKPASAKAAPGKAAPGKAAPPKVVPPKVKGNPGKKTNTPTPKFKCSIPSCGKKYFTEEKAEQCFNSHTNGSRPPSPDVSINDVDR